MGAVEVGLISFTKGEESIILNSKHLKLQVIPTAL